MQGFPQGTDHYGSELQRARAHGLSVDPTPAAGNAGLFWFDVVNATWKYSDGTSVIDPRDRAKGIGTQTASTISDLPTVVKAYRLDEFAAATSPITVPDGTLSTHAASKGQLDTAIASLASGQVPKGAVKAAATSNINISSAPSTIDGVTPSSGDLVLLTAQSTGTQNGPYVWNGAGSAMTRATNWDTNGEAVLGSYWVVQQGTKADQFALLTNDSAITLGTTTPAFTFIAAGASYVAGNGLTLTGTTFDVGAGTGISVAADSIAIDTAVVLRKVTGSLPAATSGIFTVSGAVVTVNHALNNSCPDLVVRAGSVPPTINGYTTVTGQELHVDNLPTDANNLAITLPAAPATNNYSFTLSG